MDGLILAVVGVAALVHFGGIAVLMVRSAAPRGPQPLARPPITILRPACGIENHVEETLASAFAIDYPTFEIIFSVADPDDPVIPLIRKLIAAYPETAARLIVGDERISINPKLNNLVKGWSAARYDWIVMADSNVLVPPDYLDRLLASWRPDTGLVCSPPIGTRPDGIGADLECAFLNTYEARWQLLADSIGQAFAQGKTMLWHRPDLDEAGGIRALAIEPAEDAASTKLVRGAGRRVRLVAEPFPQPLGKRSVEHVWRRQVRWARLRRSSFPAMYALEVVSGGLIPLTAAAGFAVSGGIPLSGFVVFLAVWYGAELLLARRFGWPASPRIAALLVLRDLLLPLLWVAGWTGNRFVWRGNAMDIRTGAGHTGEGLVLRWGLPRRLGFGSLMAIAGGKRHVASMERGNRAPRSG